MENVTHFATTMIGEETRLGLAPALVVGAALVGIFLHLWSKGSKPRNALPRFQVTTPDVVGVLEEAYKECPKDPFMLCLPGMEMAVLPASEIETIRTLPETVVSIKKHHYDVFLGEYTYMGTKADEFDKTMRNLLTRNTPVVLASFTDEVSYAVGKMIGKCDDWTEITPRYAMSRIASLMSGRSFVGLPLSREEAWVEATVNYTGSVSQAWMILRLIPQPIRYLVSPFLPQVRSLKEQRRVNEVMLAPVLAEKESGSKKKDIPGGDMLDWFISQYSHHPTVKELGRDQLLATFASIYNLSNALTYVIFDLAAADPADVEQMRAEVMEHVGFDGVITKNNLPKLRKLDSFAKESQRLCPPSLVNIPRIVTSPDGLKLSTGHVLPTGTRMTILAHAINRDREIYPDPDTFKPFRFSDLRAQPGNELKYQHATTGIDNINFGHGIWACPGRFFASAEIKVILAHLLLHYDIKLRPGEEKPRQQHFGLAILPDPNAVVLFKKRV
ncbi:cytochrome P450 monooxygenase [Apiospora arundinis]|uniref:Cytochrome P450 monooxygenase n=1 Tax=Apiospora arundinis TaxID=335852 RepID=A0ABR2I346_9PEZI